MSSDVSSCKSIYNLRYRPFKATVSAVVLVAFLFNIAVSDLAWARDASASIISSRDMIKSLPIDTITIPSYLGYIKDSWQSQRKRNILIHIQDAHCNYGAQNSIAALIEYLTSHYGVEVINLEGGDGSYDLSPFTNIGDAARRKKVSDYFLKEGEINAAEFYASNNPHETTLWGVEDADLYMANLNVYRDSLKYKDDCDKSLRELESALAVFKAKIYSEELLAFERKADDFKDKKADLKDHVNFITKFATGRGTDTSDLVELNKLDKTLILEDGIDFTEANRERERLIDKLSKSLSKNEFKDLAAKAIEFKLGRMQPAEFHGYLAQKAKDLDIELSLYKNLNLYIEYVKRYDDIKKEALFNEISLLEARIEEKLSRNDDERKLIGLAKNFVIIKNLLNITLTQEEFKYYRKHRDEFETRNFKSFLGKKAYSYGLSIKLDGEIDRLGAYLRKMERFYELSYKRDDEFIKRLKFEEPGSRKEAIPKVTILITGGFHTENLTKLLKKKGISYVSIMPNFELDGEECPYFKILSGGQDPILKALLESESAIQVASYLNEPVARRAYPAGAGVKFGEAVGLIDRCFGVREGGFFEMSRVSNGMLRGLKLIKNTDGMIDTVWGDLRGMKEEGREATAAAASRESSAGDDTADRQPAKTEKEEKNVSQNDIHPTTRPQITLPNLKYRVMRLLRRMAIGAAILIIWWYMPFIGLRHTLRVFAGKELSQRQDIGRYAVSRVRAGAGIDNLYAVSSFENRPSLTRIFLCLDENTLPISPYKPSSISNNRGTKYYSIKPWSYVANLNQPRGTGYYWKTELLRKLLVMKQGEILYFGDKKYHQNYYVGPFVTDVDLGNYMVSLGKDEKGVYLSVYDVWDYNVGEGWFRDKPISEKIKGQLLELIGKPIYIYDRYYLSEKEIVRELTRRQKSVKSKHVSLVATSYSYYGAMLLKEFPKIDFADEKRILAIDGYAEQLYNVLITIREKYPNQFSLIKSMVFHKGKGSFASYGIIDIGTHDIESSYLTYTGESCLSVAQTRMEYIVTHEFSHQLAFYVSSHYPQIEAFYKNIYYTKVKSSQGIDHGEFIAEDIRNYLFRGKPITKFTWNRKTKEIIDFSDSASKRVFYLEKIIELTQKRPKKVSVDAIKTGAGFASTGEYAQGRGSGSVSLKAPRRSSTSGTMEIETYGIKHEVSEDAFNAIELLTPDRAEQLGVDHAAESIERLFSEIPRSPNSEYNREQKLLEIKELLKTSSLRQKTADGTYLYRCIWIYAKNGEIAGYLSGKVGEGADGTNNKFAYIDEIAVDPEFRRSGIGDALWGRMIQYMERSGVMAISVHVTGDGGSRKIATSFGFKNTGISTLLDFDGVSKNNSRASTSGWNVKGYIEKMGLARKSLPLAFDRKEVLVLLGDLWNEVKALNGKPLLEDVYSEYAARGIKPTLPSSGLKDKLLALFDKNFQILTEYGQGGSSFYVTYMGMPVLYVAAQAVGNNTAAINEIWVNSALQNTGIITKLNQKVIEHLARKGFSDIRSDTIYLMNKYSKDSTQKAEGIYVDENHFEIEDIATPLLTNGLITCVAVTIINKEKGRHFLAHINEYATVADIVKVFDNLDFLDDSAEIGLLSGMLRSEVTDRIAQALDEKNIDTKRIKNIIFEGATTPEIIVVDGEYYKPAGIFYDRTSVKKVREGIANDGIMKAMLAEDTMWVGFMDMAKAGLRNGVFGRQVMDIVIDEAFKVISQALKDKCGETGFYGAFKISGDEIGFGLSGRLKTEEVQAALIEAQKVLRDRFSDKEHLESLAQKMRNNKIPEDDIRKFTGAGYVPFEPAGCVKVGSLHRKLNYSDNSRRIVRAEAILSEALKDAEIVQGYAKEEVGGVMELVKVVENFKAPKKVEPSILTASEKRAIARAKNDMQANGFVKQYALEEDYPALKRNDDLKDNLSDIINNIARQTGQTTCLVRGPPDSFYLVRAYGKNQVQVIKISAEYRALNIKTVTAFNQILKRSGREPKKRESDSVKYYGFKIPQDASRVYEGTGHGRGNDWIKLENLGIYNAFNNTPNQKLTDEEILKKLSESSQLLNSHTIVRDHKKLSFKVVFDASCVSSDEISQDGRNTAETLLPVIEQLSDARNSAKRVGFANKKTIESRDVAKGKTSPEVKSYLRNAGNWDAIEHENQAARNARAKRDEIELAEADRNLKESLRLILNEPFEPTKDMIARDMANLNKALEKLTEEEKSEIRDKIERAVSEHWDVDKTLEYIEDILPGLYYHGYGLADAATVVGGGRAASLINISEDGKNMLADKQAKGGAIFRSQGIALAVVFNPNLDTRRYSNYYKTILYDIRAVRVIINDSKNRTFLRNHLPRDKGFSIRKDMPDSEIEKLMEFFVTNENPVQGIFLGFPREAVKAYIDPVRRRQECFSLSGIVAHITGKEGALKPFTGFVATQSTLGESIDSAIRAWNGWRRAAVLLENMDPGGALNEGAGEYIDGEIGSKEPVRDVRGSASGRDLTANGPHLTDKVKALIDRSKDEDLPDDERLASLLEAYALAPEQLSISNQIAQFYYDLKNYVEAGNWARRTLQNSSELEDEYPLYAGNNCGRAHGILSKVYLMQERYEEALDEADAYIALNPRNPVAINHRFEVLYNIGRYEGALRVVQEALEYAPNHRTSYGNLSRALYALGRYEGASKAADERIRLAPDYPVGYALKFNAEYALGNYESAYESAKEHRALASKRNDLADNLLMLSLLSMGRIDEAGDMVKDNANLNLKSAVLLAKGLKILQLEGRGAAKRYAETLTDRRYSLALKGWIKRITGQAPEPVVSPGDMALDAELRQYILSGHSFVYREVPEDKDYATYFPRGSMEDDINKWLDLTMKNIASVQKLPDGEMIDWWPDNTYVAYFPFGDKGELVRMVVVVENGKVVTAYPAFGPGISYYKGGTPLAIESLPLVPESFVIWNKGSGMPVNVRVGDGKTGFAAMINSPILTNLEPIEREQLIWLTAVEGKPEAEDNNFYYYGYEIPFSGWKEALKDSLPGSKAFLKVAKRSFIASEITSSIQHGTDALSKKPYRASTSGGGDQISIWGNLYTPRAMGEGLLSEVKRLNNGRDPALLHIEGKVNSSDVRFGKTRSRQITTDAPEKISMLADVKPRDYVYAKILDRSTDERAGIDSYRIIVARRSALERNGYELLKTSYDPQKIKSLDTYQDKDVLLVVDFAHRNGFRRLVYLDYINLHTAFRGNRYMSEAYNHFAYYLSAHFPRQSILSSFSSPRTKRLFIEHFMWHRNPDDPAFNKVDVLNSKIPDETAFTQRFPRQAKVAQEITPGPGRASASGVNRLLRRPFMLAKSLTSSSNLFKNIKIHIFIPAAMLIIIWWYTPLIGLRHIARKVAYNKICAMYPPDEMSRGAVKDPDSMMEYSTDGANVDRWRKSLRTNNLNGMPNILRIYLCLDQNTLPLSTYRPSSVSNGIAKRYYSVKPWSYVAKFDEQDLTKEYYWPTDVLVKLITMKRGEIAYYDNDRKYYYASSEHFSSLLPPFLTMANLGNYLFSFGKDQKGLYLSIYDAYDFNPHQGSFKGDRGGPIGFGGINIYLMNAIGRPIYIYDRYYLSEKEIKKELTRRRKSIKKPSVAPSPTKPPRASASGEGKALELARDRIASIKTDGLLPPAEQQKRGMRPLLSYDLHGEERTWINCNIIYSDAVVSRDWTASIRSALLDRTNGMLHAVMERPFDLAIGLIQWLEGKTEGDFETLLSDRSRHSAILVIDPEKLSKKNQNMVWPPPPYIYDRNRAFELFLFDVPPEAIKAIFAPRALSGIVRETFKDTVTEVVPIDDEMTEETVITRFHFGTKERRATIRMPNYLSPLVSYFSEQNKDPKRPTEIVILHAVRFDAPSDIDEHSRASASGYTENQLLSIRSVIERTVDKMTRNEPIGDREWVLDNIWSIRDKAGLGKHKTLYYPACGGDVVRTLLAYDAERIIAVDKYATGAERTLAASGVGKLAVTTDTSRGHTVKTCRFELGGIPREIVEINADVRDIDINDFAERGTVDVLHVYLPTGAEEVVSSVFNRKNYDLVNMGGFIVLDEAPLTYGIETPGWLLDLLGLKQMKVTSRHPLYITTTFYPSREGLADVNRDGYIYQKIREINNARFEAGLEIIEMLDVLGYAVSSVETGNFTTLKYIPETLVGIARKLLQEGVRKEDVRYAFEGLANSIRARLEAVQRRLTPEQLKESSRQDLSEVIASAYADFDLLESGREGSRRSTSGHLTDQSVIYHGTLLENVENMIFYSFGYMSPHHPTGTTDAVSFAFHKESSKYYAGRGKNGIILEFDYAFLKNLGLQIEEDNVDYEIAIYNPVPLISLTRESKLEVARRFLSDNPAANEHLAKILGYKTSDDLRKDMDGHKRDEPPFESVVTDLGEGHVSRFVLANFRDTVRDSVFRYEIEAFYDELVRGVPEGYLREAMNKIYAAYSTRGIISFESLCSKLNWEERISLVDFILAANLNSLFEESGLWHGIKDSRGSMSGLVKKMQLSPEDTSYKDMLFERFAEHRYLTFDERYALVDAITRSQEGALRLREEFFTEDDIANILRNKEFDIRAFVNKIISEKVKYQEFKGPKNNIEFTPGQIQELLFERLIPIRWFERLVADRLSKSDIIHIIRRHPDPLEAWTNELKPAREGLVRDKSNGLSKTDATRLVIRRTDPEKAWEILKPKRDRLVEEGVAPSKATRLVINNGPLEILSTETLAARLKEPRASASGLAGQGHGVTMSVRVSKEIEDKLESVMNNGLGPGIADITSGTPSRNYLIGNIVNPELEWIDGVDGKGEKILTVKVKETGKELHVFRESNIFTPSTAKETLRRYIGNLLIDEILYAKDTSILSVAAERPWHADLNYPYVDDDEATPKDVEKKLMRSIVFVSKLDDASLKSGQPANVAELVAAFSPTVGPLEYKTLHVDFDKLQYILVPGELKDAAIKVFVNSHVDKARQDAVRAKIRVVGTREAKINTIKYAFLPVTVPDYEGVMSDIVKTSPETKYWAHGLRLPVEEDAYRLEEYERWKAGRAEARDRRASTSGEGIAGDEIVPETSSSMYQALISGYLELHSNFVEGVRAELEGMRESGISEEEIEARGLEFTLGIAEGELETANDNIDLLTSHMKGDSAGDFVDALRSLDEDAISRPSTEQKMAIGIVRGVINKHPEIDGVSYSVLFLPRYSWIRELFGWSRVRPPTAALLEISDANGNMVNLILISDHVSDTLSVIKILLHEILHTQFNEGRRAVRDEKKNLYNILEESMAERQAILLMGEISSRHPKIRKMLFERFPAEAGMVKAMFGRLGIAYWSKLCGERIFQTYHSERSLLDSIFLFNPEVTDNAVIEFLRSGGTRGLQQLLSNPPWNLASEMINTFCGRRGSLTYYTGIHVIASSLRQRDPERMLRIGELLMEKMRECLSESEFRTLMDNSHIEYRDKNRCRDEAGIRTFDELLSVKSVNIERDGQKIKKRFVDNVKKELKRAVASPSADRRASTPRESSSGQAGGVAVKAAEAIVSVESLIDAFNGKIITTTDGVKNYALIAKSSDEKPSTVEVYLKRMGDGAVSKNKVFSFSTLVGDATLYLDKIEFIDEPPISFVSQGLGTRIFEIFGQAMPEGETIYGEVYNEKTRRDLRDKYVTRGADVVRKKDGAIVVNKKPGEIKNGEVSIEQVIADTLIAHLLAKGGFGAISIYVVDEANHYEIIRDAKALYKLIRDAEAKGQDMLDTFNLSATKLPISITRASARRQSTSGQPGGTAGRKALAYLSTDKPVFYQRELSIRDRLPRIFAKRPLARSMQRVASHFVEEGYSRYDRRILLKQAYELLIRLDDFGLSRVNNVIRSTHHLTVDQFADLIDYNLLSIDTGVNPFSKDSPAPYIFHMFLNFVKSSYFSLENFNLTQYVDSHPRFAIARPEPHVRSSRDSTLWYHGMVNTFNSAYEILLGHSRGNLKWGELTGIPGRAPEFQGYELLLEFEFTGPEEQRYLGAGIELDSTRGTGIKEPIPLSFLTPRSKRDVMSKLIGAEEGRYPFIADSLGITMDEVKIFYEEEELEEGCLFSSLNLKLGHLPKVITVYQGAAIVHSSGKDDRELDVTENPFEAGIAMTTKDIVIEEAQSFASRLEPGSSASHWLRHYQIDMQRIRALKLEDNSLPLELEKEWREFLRERLDINVTLAGQQPIIELPFGGPIEEAHFGYKRDFSRFLAERYDAVFILKDKESRPRLTVLALNPFCVFPYGMEQHIPREITGRASASGNHNERFKRIFGVDLNDELGEGKYSKIFTLAFNLSANISAEGLLGDRTDEEILNKIGLYWLCRAINDSRYGQGFYGFNMGEKKLGYFDMPEALLMLTTRGLTAKDVLNQGGYDVLADVMEYYYTNAMYESKKSSDMVIDENTLIALCCEVVDSGHKKEVVNSVAFKTMPKKVRSGIIEILNKVDELIAFKMGGGRESTSGVERETILVRELRDARELDKPVRVLIPMVQAREKSPDTVEGVEETQRLKIEAQEMRKMLERINNYFADSGSKIEFFKVQPGNDTETINDFNKVYGTLGEGLTGETQVICFVPQCVRNTVQNQQQVHFIQDALLDGRQPDIMARLALAYNLAYYLRHPDQSRQEYAARCVVRLLENIADISRADIVNITEDLKKIFELDFTLKIKPVDFKKFDEYRIANEEVLRAL